MLETLTNTFASPLSQEDYAKCFKTYKKISTEWDVSLKWIQDKLLKNISRKNYYRILSVGCGAGEFDIRFIGILKEKTKAIVDYIAVEPNDVHCQEFKTCLDQCLFPGLRPEICPVTFNKFHSNKHFDLIHFTHSLYYIDNREQAILYALDLTFDEGQVLIINQTPSGINQIQNMFLERVTGNANYMFSSNDLEKILIHYSIFYESEIVDCFLDVTELYDDLESEFSQNLMNFLLESKVSQLSPAIRSEIFDYIKKLSVYKKGRRLLYHPVAIFSLFKKPGAGL